MTGPADSDGDGVPDADDNCPNTANPGQFDEDADGLGNRCDRCPAVADDQTDSDGDGVGDACDPQPGEANSLLFFEGFDGALDDDWAGADDWTVAGGALIQADNSQRFYLRYTAVDASDDVVFVASTEFANPLGPNAVSLRFGGIYVEASDDPTNNGCWVVRALGQGDEGFGFVNVDDGSVSYIVPLVAQGADEDAEYIIAAAKAGNTTICDVAGQSDGRSSINGLPNYGGNDLGLVASFTEMTVRWVYAIRLQ